MNKIFFFFAPFLFFCTMYALAPIWAWEKDLSLEKEQIYKANFSVGAVQKELEFRWTLYKNYGLILHIRYDKFNHQVLLYTDYQRNAYKISLGRGSSAQKDNPHLIMYFKEFADKDKKAHLKLYIEGQGAAVLDESISPSKNKQEQEEQEAEENTTQGQAS